jgi:prevent-host-death family protein
MSIYDREMDISVSQFKQHCLDIIRRVERTGRPVTITRRGRVVARLQPPPALSEGRRRPWEALRGLGGRLLADPGESVVRDEDFEALR